MRKRGSISWSFGREALRGEGDPVRLRDGMLAAVEEASRKMKDWSSVVNIIMG